MNNLEQGNLYQLGGAYLTGTNAFVPPTGKVVVKIEIMTATKFEALVPANDAGSNTYHLGTTVANITNSSNNLDVEGNGTNAVAIPSGSSGLEFAVGKVLYGRWSSVDLAAGTVIMYFGQA